MNQLLTEKYRPQTLKDYVFVNEEHRKKFSEWIEKKSLDSHIILYGKPGMGKTSLVNVLINELGITDCIRYNMSDKTSIDDMRRVIEFASSTPLNDSFKLVILEEFERASAQAQDSLKYVMEQYSGWCRFILTSNNISKISPAIQSRCQRFEFNTLNMEQFITRIVKILTDENIRYNSLDCVYEYVKTYYPDLRACINAIDQNTINNELQTLNKNTMYSVDKFKEVVTQISTLDILSLKKLLAQNIADEEFELLYQYMYNNLDLITTNINKWDMILLSIAKHLYQNSSVAFSDINFMSCIIEIRNIINDGK